MGVIPAGRAVLIVTSLPAIRWLDCTPICLLVASTRRTRCLRRYTAFRESERSLCWEQKLVYGRRRAFAGHLQAQSPTPLKTLPECISITIITSAEGCAVGLPGRYRPLSVIRVSWLNM